MKKETFRVGKLSDALDAANVPLSPVVKANGFIFVSGQPPLDAKTGELVKGDIRTQTEYVMENLKLCLETAGSSLLGSATDGAGGYLRGLRMIGAKKNLRFHSGPAVSGWTT